MTEFQRHHCPSCGKAQNPVPRYPWYICRQCLKLAEDHAGRRLVFGNVALSGGLWWGYADEEKHSGWDCPQVICLIKKRCVIVREAKFGGVVAQPVLNFSLYPREWMEKGIDLSKPPVPGKRN